jgi:alpha-D-xyloside xylohydrolase
MKLILFMLISLLPVFSQGQDVKGYKQVRDRIEVTLEEGTLSICPLSDNAVRIKFYKGVEVHVPELIFTSSVRTARLHVSDSHSKLEIKGKNIIVELDKQTGKLSFANNSGKIFLSEKAETRKLVPDSVMGEPCFMAEQSFESPADEYIYGLGQFQDGHYNLRNITRKLTQVNSQISIPFIYSSKGYGLLWHQYGLTEFNPADNFVTLEKQEHSASGNNQLAEVTTTSGTQKVSQNQSLFTGKFTVPSDGVYSIFLDLGDG